MKPRLKLITLSHSRTMKYKSPATGVWHFICAGGRVGAAQFFKSCLPRINQYFAQDVIVLAMRKEREYAHQD